MDNPLITSNYVQNNFESLASLLNEEGYKAHFFMGYLMALWVLTVIVKGRVL